VHFCETPRAVFAHVCVVVVVGFEVYGVGVGGLARIRISVLHVKGNLQLARFGWFRLWFSVPETRLDVIPIC